MNGPSQVRFSKGSLVFIGISLILLGVIVGLGIFPARTEKTRLQAVAKNLEARLEEQKIFTPLHASISQKMNQKRGLEEIIEALRPYPEPVQVDNAAQALLTMADEAGMAESFFVPVPVSVTQETARLLLEGRMAGDLQSFRSFLLTISAWPSLDHIELLEIESQPETPEYRMRIWVSLG